MGSDSGLIRVTYRRSAIGFSRKQKDTIRSLGFRRLGQSVVHTDNPAIRGMIGSVSHLVEVEPVPDAEIVAVADEDSDEMEALAGGEN